MLNITVLVLILMHTVWILIEEGLSKGFKGCGSQISRSASSHKLVSVSNSLDMDQVRNYGSMFVDSKFYVVIVPLEK
jgi:hypothetical protein